jgi:hypothetical protein
MRCWMCFQAQATFHVLDQPTADGLFESHYCAACYESLYIHPLIGSIAVADDPPPADPAAFPRLRFTIRVLMTLAAGFAIINAVLALFMRSGLVGGTPAHVRDVTIRLFLFVNTLVAVFLVEFSLYTWTNKLFLHELTGGAPRPDLKAFYWNAAWMIAWERATLLRRVFYHLCLTWPFTRFMCLGLLIPRRALYDVAARNDPLLVAVALGSFVVGVEIALCWGLVPSARRR